MVTDFERAFAVVIGIEGGYVNDPQDPGGETKFGITKRWYPNEDIPSMTIERAQHLMRRDYWTKRGCDAMPWHEALLVFDAAVNGGHPSLWREMFKGQPVKLFAQNFQAEHALYLASLAGFAHEGRGWMRRLLNVYGEATT